MLCTTTLSKSYRETELAAQLARRTDDRPRATAGMLRAIFDALREGDASLLVVFFAVIDRVPVLLWAGGIYMQLLWISAFAVNWAASNTLSRSANAFHTMVPSSAVRLSLSNV